MRVHCEVRKVCFREDTCICKAVSSWLSGLHDKIVIQINQSK